MGEHTMKNLFCAVESQKPMKTSPWFPPHTNDNLGNVKGQVGTNMGTQQNIKWGATNGLLATLNHQGNDHSRWCSGM